MIWSGRRCPRVAQGVSHEETIGTERSKKYTMLVCSNHPRGASIRSMRT